MTAAQSTLAGSARPPGSPVLSLAARLLRDTATASGMDLPDWDLAIQQCRRAGVLARICHRLERDNLLDRVPEQPARHLKAARTLADKHGRDVHWEVRCIVRALKNVDGPKILLKGAAYVMTDLPPAAGRMFTDVDLMVARERIEQTEHELIRHDWTHHEVDAYDDIYYRTWMHQIPPLIHRLRGTVIDVHHTIVPETAKPHVNARSLFDAAIRLDGYDDLYVLTPTDMVLHSAVHLFNEGEFDHGLRDLSDLDLLLRHFGKDGDFWAHLADRAAELDLERPLFYALRHAGRVLGTPVPQSLDDRLQQTRPGPSHMKVMDALLDRGLRPHHVSCDDRYSGFARWLLYVRAHHLRMPFHLLGPHLIRKAWKKRFAEE